MPAKKSKKDYLFRGTLSDLDPDVYELVELEAERQYRRLILIPSESTAPLAVREALSSAFHNIYAEGYPDEDSRWMKEEDILDYPARLGNYRRNSDPRYYKGVEYADVLEALARRRCAEVFATNGVSPDQLYVNVQALSGAPANNAVYHALVKPGDTVMGMNLLHGGHLSHGSPVNRSGKYYNIVHYTVSAETERIDYEEMSDMALAHKPKMIIGGFSSYPWAADWQAMRRIADSVGAYLLADIAHVAGLVAAGVYPSPIGYAHVVTSTTHKTLNGPRGAIILTTEKKLAEKIDRAIFPGEQGGPHVNVFAALALTFKIAKTNEFKALQAQVIKNCIAITNRLRERGLRIPFGGTNSHLTNVDCKSVKGTDGTPLSGDMAARILDLAGIVVNRNTIPGDKSARNPSGIRLGTPWVTQRGFTEADSRRLADIIADVLWACTPYRDRSETGLSQRAKVDFRVLEGAKLAVRSMADSAGIDIKPPLHGYPHFTYIDDKPKSKSAWVGIEVSGERASDLLNIALSCNVEDLSKRIRLMHMVTPKGAVEGGVRRPSKEKFLLSMKREQYGLAAAWLRALSDGYVTIDGDDLQRKAPGPIFVREATQKVAAPKGKGQSDPKPFYIGMGPETRGPLSDFVSQESSNSSLERTALYETHRRLGAKMVPFAGWEMPVWYTSVVEEHLAVRQAAGLFDVTHMGVYDARGPQAAPFLDSVCANDIRALRIGESVYTHFLDPDANVIDDLIVYRVSAERHLIVVNASNDDKDWAWLNAVCEGKVCIDRKRPASLAFGRGVRLLNLRDSAAGSEMRVDLALQGPASRKILLKLADISTDQNHIRRLKRFGVTQVTLAGLDVILSRTGYTGESMSFEIFVHPDKSVELWDALLKVGTEHGIKPCGLGARDSLRTEAGLPLYGNELAGPLDLGVGESGFRQFVKSYKPWFIGRDAFLKREEVRTRQVARFRFQKSGVRMAHLGDPVTNSAGDLIGNVTSCSVDSERYLTGQALVDKNYLKEGTKLFVYQGLRNMPIPESAQATEAIVLSRMMG